MKITGWIKSGIIIVITTVSLFVPAFSQEKVSKLLLETDLDILKSNLEQVHPGLYTYSSKEEIDKWFTETKNSLPDSMDYYQFYQAVAPLNSIIKNGHSVVRLDRFNKDYNILPVRFYKYNDSFFICDSFKDEYKELIGKEIYAINGVPIIDIFNKLLRFQTRDGYNLSFPTEKTLYYFNLDYALIYGSKDRCEITLIESSNKSQYSVTCISRKEVNFYESVPLRDYFKFEIKDSIAILRWQTFEKSDLRKIGYKKRLKEAFRLIKANHINHLIIDVRNNRGGDAVPNQELISYLYNKEFRLFKRIYTITNKIPDKKYYKNEGVFLFNNVLSWLKLKKVEKNFYSVKTKGSDLYSPKADNYTGELYILTNGRCFSATGEFTSFIKYNRGAICIGEEVGGNKYQNSSGIPYTITLPNSKLRMSIPTVLWELNVDLKNDGHGVTPDYVVKNSITAEVEHKDSVMEFTLNLIKGSAHVDK